MTLAPLRVARGMAAPASATAPPLARRGAACAGGWPFLAPPSSRHTSWSGSTAGLRVDSLPDTLRGRDALASASGVVLGEKIGGVLRGGFSRALLAACGGSALRASGGGARKIILLNYPLMGLPIYFCRTHISFRALFQSGGRFRLLQWRTLHPIFRHAATAYKPQGVLMLCSNPH